MSGETDLAALLAGAVPVLHAERYGFAVRDDASPDAFAIIREDEGATIIAPDPAGGWARISLTVHSSLAAVGLTAAISAALAGRGISANIVAGFYHDHIFVPWERRGEALAALESLGESR